MQANESPCPTCGSYTLTIALKPCAEPLGTSGLAGQTVKTSVAYRPLLECSACGLRIVGRQDGKHALFPYPD